MVKYVPEGWEMQLRKEGDRVGVAEYEENATTDI